jgi:hypothetical protein
MTIIAFIPRGTAIPKGYQNASVRRGRHKEVSSRDRFVMMDDEGRYHYPDASKVREEWDAPADEVLNVFKQEENRDEGTGTVVANRPMTEEEMLDLWGLDPKVWRATKLITNTWAHNWQTKVWWERDESNHKAGLVWEDMLGAIREESTPVKQVLDTEREGDNMGVLALFDVHLGMLAWADETGYDHWDLDIAESVVLKAAGTLLVDMARHEPDHIVIPVGNDFFHVDALQSGNINTTTRGTAQDVDGRWQKAFLKGKDIMRQIIDAAAEIAPVYVVVQPGNHDKERAWMLGQVLEALYSNDERVSFDTRPQDRRYLVFGDNLLGFHHGDRMKPEKLYRLMSQEADGWSDSIHREWIVGHIHHDRFERVDHQGMYIRTVPSISPPDAWHSEEAWIGATRQAKGLVYRAAGGVVAEYSYLV